jgi:hypothetical protein
MEADMKAELICVVLSKDVMTPSENFYPEMQENTNEPIPLRTSTSSM